MELQYRDGVTSGMAVTVIKIRVESTGHWGECREGRTVRGVTCQSTAESSAVGFAICEDLLGIDAVLRIQVGQEVSCEDLVVYGFVREGCAFPCLLERASACLE